MPATVRNGGSIYLSSLELSEGDVIVPYSDSDVAEVQKLGADIEYVNRVAVRYRQKLDLYESRFGREPNLAIKKMLVKRAEREAKEKERRQIVPETEPTE